MALVITKTPNKVKRTVTILQPTEGLNKTIKTTIELTIRKLPESEWEQVRESKRDDKEICRHMVLDIEGVRDEDGTPVPFDDDLFSALWEWDYIRIPIRNEVFTVANAEMARLLGLKN